MAVPVQTDDERRAALRKAADVRRYRAGIKKSLKDGGMSLADALADEGCERMRVSELLRSLPGVGQSRAEAIMVDLRISEGRRIKGLGSRQREELLGRFQ